MTKQKWKELHNSHHQKIEPHFIQRLLKHNYEGILKTAQGDEQDE